MRRARPLLLLLIVLIAGYLRYSYVQRTNALRDQAPPLPAKLPDGISQTVEGWHYVKSSGTGAQYALKAKNVTQVREPSHYELEQVELKIFRKGGKTFDRIVSDRAVFDMAEGSLYCEGEADITMGVAEGEQPLASRLIHIKSSGIRYQSATGKAETEREATFRLEKGEGKAVGAVYDPATRELLLKSKAELIWNGPHSPPRPMKVEADNVVYKELESKVFLTPRARLTRQNMTLEGDNAVVTMDEKGIRLVETTNAKGTDRFPGRQLEYSADRLVLNLNERSEVEHIDGAGNAKLVTTTEFGATSTSANTVDLSFDTSGEESVLTKALAKGTTVVESKPTVRPDRPTPETRVLHSEVVEMKMRPGGQEVDTIDTLTPAKLEFLPNRPGQKKRRVEGEVFHIVYARENQIDTFRASKATTHTENEPRQGKPWPPSITSSKDLVAYFAPKSGEMTRLEQSGDFQYEEGERRARAERALLDNQTGRVTLVQTARVSDPSGATSADQIILDQRTEDFQAEGRVQSSRAPERKGTNSSMLSKDEPVQATAHKMVTSDKQAVVLYDGDALLWQSGNRLQADRIEIDRKNSVLRANGKVVNVIQQQPDPKRKVEGKGVAPSIIRITSPAMVYTDKDRLAHYTGGAFMRHDDMDVKASEIRAFLKEENKDKEKKEGESSLDKAFADGNVVIVRATEGRTRRGTSEHAEYFADESKIILEGGKPVFEDSLKGSTTGRQLIYFSNDDKLLVNGAPSAPAETKVRRKPNASSPNKRTK
jgi:lipopolysaccharide export system protein LptA